MFSRFKLRKKGRTMEDLYYYESEKPRERQLRSLVQGYLKRMKHRRTTIEVILWKSRGILRLWDVRGSTHKTLN